MLDAVQEALKSRLDKIAVGNPRDEATRMGALVSLAQREAVRAKIREIATKAPIVYGDPSRVKVTGADAEKGAFLSPILLRCERPWEGQAVHDVEAFGPVSTLMPYKDQADAIALANRGKGSLVMSVFTYDTNFARDVVLGAGTSMDASPSSIATAHKESTGHGSPMPHMVHGGPRPAAARSWVASAALLTTCSGRPCKATPAC